MTHVVDIHSLRCPLKQASTRFYSALLTLALLAACGGSPPPAENTPRSVAVRVASVRVGPLREVERYVGTVRSRREVTVMAQLAGTLVALPVREGQAVAVGDVVARLDTPEVEARRARARAEFQRARSESAWLCERHATDGRLLGAGAVTRLQLDQSRGACESSRAAVRAAAAQVREVDAALEKAEERAPFDGQVLRWLAEPGESLLPGRPILLLGGEEREILVRVSESDVRRGVALSTPVLVELRPGVQVPADVVAVAPQATGPARALDVVVALPAGAESALRHGMSVDVGFIIAEAPDAVAVPLRAVRPGATGPAVFLLRGDRVERRLVTLGVSTGGFVAVEPALPHDASVVVDGPATLEDGDHVLAVRAPAREVTP